MKLICPAVVTAVLCESLLVAQGFGAPQILSSVVANYGDPITADLDGDGDQDVIVFRIFTPTSGPTDWRIVWLANDGAPTRLTPPTSTATATSTS
jgi:hypothetical protein